MRDLNTLQLTNIKYQLSHPTAVTAPDAGYKAANDFGHLPTGLDTEDWSPEEFRKRNFPFSPLPTKPPASVKTQDWDARVKYLLTNRLIHKSALPTLDMIRSWITKCVPPYLEPPGTTPTVGKHHIPPDQVQMALDSLSSFVSSGTF